MKNPYNESFSSITAISDIKKQPQFGIAFYHIGEDSDLITPNRIFNPSFNSSKVA